MKETKAGNSYQVIDSPVIPALEKGGQNQCHSFLGKCFLRQGCTWRPCLKKHLPPSKKMQLKII